MRLVVRLTPGAARDAFDGWGADEHGRRFLKVRVRAQPIEGRANAALVLFLAKALGAAKSQVRLIAGDTARLKTVEIDGIEAEDLLKHLP